MHLFKKYPKFFLFSLALTLSGIGSSVTGVAIYELMRLQGVGVEGYSFIFVLTFLPALLYSELGKRLSFKSKFSRIFHFFNLSGALLCLLNLWNLNHQQVLVYYFSVFFGGAISGAFFPLYQTLLKRTIQEEDLGTFSAYETFVFAIQFILGELLGVILFSLVGAKTFFVLDLVTFLICIAVIAFLDQKKHLSFSRIESIEEDGTAVTPKVRWSPQKKLDFTHNLSLAAVCAPLMATVLGHLSKYSTVALGVVFLSPVLLGLCARSLGQMFGPVMGGMFGIEKLSRWRFILEGLTALFLVSYGLVLKSEPLFVKAFFILCAHVFSNIAFSIAFYRFNKSFELDEFPIVSTRNYQLTTAIMILSALWAGQVLASWGEVAVLTGAALILIAISIGRFLYSSRAKVGSL